MHLLEDLNSLSEWRNSIDAQTIVLVPTMGALHSGHLKLIEVARQHGQQVIVSIFVNPTQFSPTEDLDKYPRPLESDLAQCQQLGVNAVFLPQTHTIYPHGQDITQLVPPTSLTNCLCGLSRPTHFAGVATVVYKLFALIQPHIAIFGEKDAQQLAVMQNHGARHASAYPNYPSANGARRRRPGQKLSKHLPQQPNFQRTSTQSFITPSLTSKQLTEWAKPRPSHSSPKPKQQFSPHLIEWEYLEARESSSLTPSLHLHPGVRLFGALRVLVPGSHPVRLIDNLLL